MPFREPDEAVSVDQAWSDPRHHLEWAGAEPTAVFLAVRSRDQADDLRERTALWCRRNRERWTPCEADEDSADWLRRELPRPGVLWFALWAEEQRVDVLHALNEVRIRLADSRGAPGSLRSDSSARAGCSRGCRSVARALLRSCCACCEPTLWLAASSGREHGVEVGAHGRREVSFRLATDDSRTAAHSRGRRGAAGSGAIPFPAPGGPGRCARSS